MRWMCDRIQARGRWEREGTGGHIGSSHRTSAIGQVSHWPDMPAFARALNRPAVALHAPRLTIASGVCAPGIHVRTCDRRLSVHHRERNNAGRADAMAHGKEELAMTNVVDLGWVPVGYRVASTDADAKVECERGCGWRFRVATLTHLPADARERLIRFHDDWHTKRP